jgi:hypothetical protein
VTHATPDDTTDPVALVEGLDEDAIRAALARLGRQSDALRVLLRAALARRRRHDPERQEEPCAS